MIAADSAGKAESASARTYGYVKSLPSYRRRKFPSCGGRTMTESVDGGEKKEKELRG